MPILLLLKITIFSTFQQTLESTVSFGLSVCLRVLGNAASSATPGALSGHFPTLLDLCNLVHVFLEVCVVNGAEFLLKMHKNAVLVD